ncbi:MAG: ATP-binding protein, partial [Candidatus Acidiferrum sp.]
PLLSSAELENLLDNLESDLVERKESVTSPERIRQAICAFANDLPGHGRPGYIFVGVNDNGVPTNLPITDDLLLVLAGMRDDGNILPVPSLVVEKLVLKGSSMAVVEIQPSDAPPVRFRGQVWIRVGPRRAIATMEEERRLTERQVAGVQTFDRRPCVGSAIKDILVEAFKEQYLPAVVSRDVIAENQRTTQEQLASLRLFDSRKNCPTNAGILLLGEDPLEFIPGAYIQFVRLEGDTLAAPVQDQKEVAGNLMTQLLQLDNLIPLQIRTARQHASGLQHQEKPDYPLAAIREFVLNAVLHRSYEATNAPVRINWFNHHVEIQSPGGLYGHVNEANFGRTSDYRNPVLAEAMKGLGYVERFGAGIIRAQAALAANGNPPAEFTIEPTHVLVVVREMK